jgi:CRP-like cAMP-binding protein
VAALARVELFSALTREEREALASHLTYAPFVAGDVMTHQGAVAHWLYLIIEGEAEVWREHAGGGRERVNVLHPGSVFGEMGMMTGEPRRATVTARTDVTCYRLDKAGFETILHARPDIAEAISNVLSTREAELAAHFGPRPGRTAADSHANAILARMRRFFGIEGKKEEPATPLRG